jgi:predicted MPP superfamily phosphohydrolase
MGLLIYLLMALGFVWMIFGLGKLVGSSPDMRLVFIFFLMFAGLVSGYGIWRAQNPVLKHLEVEIKGLPEFWRNKVIVHLSDVHLGTIHRKAFMKRVADEVNNMNPDLILITGDLFDGMGGKMPQFVESIASMKATQGKYFITGNHEGYLGLKRPLSVIREAGIIVLDNEIIDLEGLQVVGISYPEYKQGNATRNLLLDSGSYDAFKPSILLYHTPTNIEEEHTDLGSQQANTYWFPDTSMALAKEVGIDLQLSGHTHKGQLFPFGFLTKIIYKGYDYGLHRDGDFQIYITSGVGTWGPPMRLGAPPEIVVIRLR